MDEQIIEQPEARPSLYTLFHLTRAYNRGEISFEECIERTKVRDKS